MSKRIFLVFIMCLAFLFVVCNVDASVQGTWPVDGTARAKVTIQGHSAGSAVNFTDEFTFSQNGDFAMTDMTGTWTQKKNKFTVLLDPADVQAYLDSALGGVGYNIIMTVTKCTLTGTEGKSTISGKMTLNAKIFLPDYGSHGLHGTVTATATFAGARIAGSSVAESAGVEVSESLKAAIFEQVAKSLGSLKK